MSRIPRLRRVLYRSAADLGDLDAARRGPAAYARRRVRRASYRTSGRALYRLLRSLGLGR